MHLLYTHIYTRTYIDRMNPSWGEKLRELLVSHGTFDAVEVQLENVHIEEQTDKLRGGWHTEASLLKEGWTTPLSCIPVCECVCVCVIFRCLTANLDICVQLLQLFSQLCWLRDMIEHSKKWATARNLIEKSEVHGEYEWRVPVMREFEHNKVDQQKSSQQVQFVTQDQWCCS